MKYFDHLIIGSGIGGTYCAARLKKIKPNDSIIIMDKNTEFGGLQTSIKTYDGVTIELGPIRFYESIHLRIKALAEKYKTPLIEYLPSFDGQVAYLRGKQYKMTNLYPESDQSYDIDQEEKGKDPFVLLENNLKKLIPKVDELYTLEGRIELARNNKQFSTKTFQDLAQMEMSQENFQRILDILGYDDLLVLNNSFLVAALEFLSLSDKSQKQFRFKEGYSSLTKKIAKRNKIDVIEFKDISKNNISKTSCVFNTEIIKIKKSKCDNAWIITYGKTKINSVEQINNKITKIKKIKVKNVYYTGSTKLLTRIYDFNNEYEHYFKYSFININAVRIYLRYSEDWMTNNGVGFGKSVTTLPGGQIIHYDDKYVMFYIFGSQSNVLHSKIPSFKQVQKELIKPTPETNPLIEECIKILKTTFNITELPKVTDIAWATWSESVRIHAARNLQSLDDSETMFTMMNKLMFPFGRNGNFYIMSNEIGLNSAWCDGSIENVDYFLHKKYNQNLFGPDML